MAEEEKRLTIVTTTGLTNATSTGYLTEPKGFDLSAAHAPIKTQWEEAVGVLSNIFFTESDSSRCVLEELEIAMELKVEGGFRFMLSGNLAAAGSIRAKFRRKDQT